MTNICVKCIRDEPDVGCYTEGEMYAVYGCRKKDGSNCSFEDASEILVFMRDGFFKGQCIWCVKANFVFVDAGDSLKGAIHES